MQKISGLIGKEAITLADASCRGTVLNVYFDAGLTKCKHFTLVCDDNDAVEWVDFKNLCSLNNDAVVIKSESCIKDCPDGGVTASPINLPAFNQDGVLLGVIRDIELDGDKPVNIITDLKTIPANTLLSMSGQLLVFNDSDQPLKLKKTSKKSKGVAANAFAGQKSHAVIPAPPKTESKKAGYELITPQTEIPKGSTEENKADAVKSTLQKAEENPPAPLKFPIYRQSVEFAKDTTENTKKETQSSAEFTTESLTESTTKKGDWLSGREVQTPSKIPPQQTSVYRSPAENQSDESTQSRYYFLLGKRVQRPIYGRNGQILAHENALVDETIIRRVKENGKLVMLALHSL